MKPRIVPTLGGLTPAGGDKTLEQHIGEMGVSTAGESNVGGEPGAGGDVHYPLPKHYIPTYHDWSDIGAVSGGGAVAGGEGGQEMVVAGGIGLERSARGSEGSVGRRADGRVGIWKQDKG